MKFCPNCGTALSGHGNFCHVCGFKLNLDPAPPAAPTFVPPVVPPSPTPTFVPPPAPVYEPPVAPPPYMPPQQPYAYPPQQADFGKPAAKKSKLPLVIGICIAIALIILAFLYGPKLLDYISAEVTSPTNKATAETTVPLTAVGRYQATSITLLGVELTGELLTAAGETWLDIQDGGLVTLMLMDDEIRGTYTLNGDTISCDLEGIIATGTWGDAKVILTAAAEGEEIVMHFTKSNVKTPAITEPTVETTVPAITANYDWWNGDWYGWWIVTDGTGKYQHMVDNYWDACATIAVNGTTGTLTLWDENTGKTAPLANASLEFSEGTGSHGAFTTTAGSFMDGAVAWLVDSDGGNARMFENMICITGTYTNAESGDTFAYAVYLRPWGEKWEDVKAGHPDAPYEDMMPIGYKSWYLPLINSGAATAPGDIN